jgi:hypothetical protein
MTSLTADGPVHRALQVLSDWPPDPATTSLRKVPGAEAPVKKTTAEGSVLYTDRRGRAIWFPGLFAATNPKKPFLACYHRNQVFGSMQVESLSGLVKETVELIRSGTRHYDLNPTHRACVRHACNSLEAIYDGDRNHTYRSATLKRQIEQNDLDDLNDMRRILAPGKAPLGAAPAQPPPPPKP